MSHQTLLDALVGGSTASRTARPDGELSHQAVIMEALNGIVARTVVLAT